jgi:hypothetical protein
MTTDPQTTDTERQEITGAHGSLHREIVRAERLAADRNRPHPEAGDTLVVYLDADGRAWARWEPEFEDGRFEKLAPTP